MKNKFKNSLHRIAFTILALMTAIPAAALTPGAAAAIGVTGGVVGGITL